MCRIRGEMPTTDTAITAARDAAAAPRAPPRGERPRRRGAAGRQPAEAHREDRDQQQADPEAGARRQHDRDAADDPVGPAPARRRGDQAERGAEHEGQHERPRPRARSEAGKRSAMTWATGALKVIESPQIAGQRVARPEQEAFRRGDVEAPGRGDELALLGGPPATTRAPT